MRWIDYDETLEGCKPIISATSSVRAPQSEVLSLLITKTAEVCQCYSSELFDIWDYSLHRTFQQGGHDLIAIHTAGVAGFDEFIDRAWAWDYVYIVAVGKSKDGWSVALYELPQGSVVVKELK